MSGGHVVDIEQDLVAALSAPYLVAGVARIPQDGPDGRLAPGKPVAVWVASGVMAGGEGTPSAVSRSAMA
jgi:hypothetical protein